MNKPEFYFAGALFSAVCALSSSQWPDYAALICIGCALLAAVLFWRGFILHTQARSDAENQRQQDYQNTWTGQYQQMQMRYDTLQQSINALEKVFQEQGECLTSCMKIQQTAAEDLKNISAMLDTAAAQSKAGTDRTHELLGQYISEFKNSMTEQDKQRLACTDRLAAESTKLCELLNQQCTDSASHFENLLAVTKGIEKVCQQFPHEIHNLSNTLDQTAAQSKAETERTHELLGQYGEELKDSLAEQNRQRTACTDRLAAGNTKLCELLNQQCTDSASHFENLLAVTKRIEKECQQFPQEIHNLSNTLDQTAAQSKAETERTHELLGQYGEELKDSLAEQNRQRTACTDRLAAGNTKLCELLNQQRKDTAFHLKNLLDETECMQELLGQYGDELKESLAKQYKLQARFATDSSKLYELLNQQHKETASHMTGLLTVLMNMEKELKQYPQETQSSSAAITNALSQVESKISGGARQLRECIREGNDQRESQFGDLKEALENQLQLIEIENAKQRDLVESVMQKYSDITAKDLEALQLIMG